MDESASNALDLTSDASFTIPLAPGGEWSDTREYLDLTLAQGLTRKTIRLEFIDAGSGQNMRTETISGGATFNVRNNFSGRKTITVRITNKADEENLVNLNLY